MRFNMLMLSRKSFQNFNKTLVSIIVIGFILLFVNNQADAKENPFMAGEKVVYKLFYNWNFVWLSAGEVSFEVKDEGEFYHIEVVGRTYSSYEWFYKVRDKFHTYIDKKTLQPRLFIRDIQEGSYHHYEKIVFDYSKNEIYSFVGKSIGTTTLKVLPMQSDLYDLISTMYFLRSIDKNLLKSKNKIPFKMILDNEIYNLNIACAQESKLSVKESGTYQTLNCIAQVIEGSVFKKNTLLKVNIGDDENKLPVNIESPLSVGSVIANLNSYANLKYPLSSKF